MKRTPKSTNTRRRFLARAGGVAAAVGSGLIGSPLIAEAQGRQARVEPVALTGSKRRDKAFDIRYQAALEQKNAAWPEHKTNGDEARYANRIGNFSKSLPHNRLGEVDPGAYDLLVKAVGTGNPEDFENIPLGGNARLADPQACFAYTLEGSDAQQFAVEPPPAFNSEQMAGEVTELYWMAILRDVSFTEYTTHPLAAAAAEDLARFQQFRTPDGKPIQPRLLFRGPTRGDQVGPYVSQFLLKDVPYGARRMDQRIRTTVPGDDHLLIYTDWIRAQNGGSVNANRLEQNIRYVINGRDLAEWVHLDFTYQAFLNAALILLGMRVPFDSRNPYRVSVTQSGFGTFGGPHVLDLLSRVTTAVLKATWFQKWALHRNLRPEEYGGRIHNHITGAAKYPIPESLLKSPALETVARRHTTYLLPQAYAEGAPTHPSFVSGHAAFAGACATALKACFHETTVIAESVVPGSSGLALAPYQNQVDRLTVGGELDKLASNIAIGRNHAGIHYRSDAMGGIRLGEAVALSVMRDMKECFHQMFQGFSLTKFDGTTVIV
jgi:membrane-associated phospholipid phosphatase